MKMILSAIAFSFAASTSLAQSTTGGVKTHDLFCSSATPAMVGLSISLKCHTQALAPQQSLRGCDVITTEGYFGAETITTPLTMVKQTEKSAYLTLENSTMTVIVKKSNLSAKIYEGSELSFNCSL